MVAQPSPAADYEYIDSPDALTRFCDSLQKEPWVALDTEFIRERSYYPRLCLIQLGVPGRYACIDPLRIDNLGPVFKILYDPTIVKVLHACSQDLEIFVHLKGEVPAPIFDTQLAAPLLGMPEQMGYGNFVREMLGVSLDKTQSRTDWSHRPLSRSQLEYAADDVRYLARLYPELCDRLQELGRLEWLGAEFEQYEQPARYIPDADKAWLRLRGLEKLRPKALSVIQLLACWREQMAQRKDLPRNWILKDEVLIDIARLAPDTLEKLGKIRGLQVKSVERYGDQILGLVQQGLKRQPLPLPGSRKRVRKPTAQEEALADILHAQLRLLAERFSINSSVLAGRKDLLSLAQGDEELSVLKGWRRKMAGLELLALRDGQCSLRIENGQVMIDRRRERDAAD